MARLVQYQKVTLCFILLLSLQKVFSMKFGVEGACLNCLDAGIEMSYSAFKSLSRHLQGLLAWFLVHLFCA